MAWGGGGGRASGVTLRAAGGATASHLCGKWKQAGLGPEWLSFLRCLGAESALISGDGAERRRKPNRAVRYIKHAMFSSYIYILINKTPLLPFIKLHSKNSSSSRASL